MASKKKMSEPMDPGAPETIVGTPQVPMKRVAYALSTLVNETQELFPETTHTFSGFDGRGTALEATFELASLTHDDQVTLAALLDLVKTDRRVLDVTYDAAEQLVHVALHPSARTQDIRDSFKLAEAYDILIDGAPDADGIEHEPLRNLAGESL